MKIAIPVWDNRVSPVFDNTAHIIFAEADNKQISSKEVINVQSLTIFQRIELLNKLKPDLFICGGITQTTMDSLQSKNINVIPFICGDTQKIIKAAIQGKDIKKLFSMPGQQKKEK